MSRSTQHLRTRQAVAVALVATGCTSLAACAPSSGGAVEPSSTVVELGISDDDYTLEKLVAAAQEEGPLTVYDSTGKTTDIAAAFTEKYGIETTAVKMKADEQLDVISREAEAENVKGDVFLNSNLPAVVSQLIPQGYVASWFPPDLVEEVPEEYQSPAVITQEANVWAYNTELNDSCPIDNVWDLADEEWAGHLTFQDPLLKSDYMYSFNQWQTHSDEQFADAYEEKFGEELETDQASAVAEWVKQLAESKPILTKSDDDAALTAGAPGQAAENQFLAFVSTAKFRDIADEGLALGMCEGIEPYSGRAYQKAAVIATGTDNPNAAKLFVHFVYTEEGIEPQLVDGKFSTNTTIEPVPDEPSGVGEIWDEEIYVFDPATAADDFATLPDWQDFWRVNS